MKKKKFCKTSGIDFVVKVLSEATSDGYTINCIAEHIVESELRGYSSHGFMRLPAIIAQLKNSDINKVSVDVGTDSFVHMNGHGNIGIPVVKKLLSIGMSCARKVKATVVSSKDYVGTTGCLGVYASELADNGFASIQFCHSEYAVAPHGSSAAVLGTNPICFGFPGRDFHFIGDVATSAWAYGSLKEAMFRNEAVPAGIVQTEEGRPSTDPNDADNGSQLPMAGHKGYVIGLAIELFCGALLGGKLGHKAVAGSDGYFAIIIDAESVQELGCVMGNAEKLYEEILRGPESYDSTGIRIPGQRFAKHKKEKSEFYVSTDVIEKILNNKF